MLECLYSPELVFAFAACFVGTAIPGPSTFAIMAVAMRTGRVRALTLAAGVLSGSLFLSLAAAFGLSSLMQTYPGSLIAMKNLGGCYLVGLAYAAARSALSKKSDPVAPTIPAETLAVAYTKGVAIQLTNPYAIFVWISIVAIALRFDSPSVGPIGVVAGCGLIGAAVYGTYALAFSTDMAQRAYRASSRWLQCALSALFAYAGIRLLLLEAIGPALN